MAPPDHPGRDDGAGGVGEHRRVFSGRSGSCGSPGRNAACGALDRLVGTDMVPDRRVPGALTPVARSSLPVPMGAVTVSGKLSIYRVIRAAMMAVRRCETAAKSCCDVRMFAAR